MSNQSLESAKEIRWFYSVIHHAALRSKRKYRRWQREMLTLNQPDTDGGVERIEKIASPTSGQALSDKEVQWMLDTLPDTQRRVMYDLYLRDWTQQQTAKHLGLYQQQVGRLRKKAIGTLRSGTRFQ